MARPKRDNNLAARALVHAVFFGDSQACANFNIARRTLHNYRSLLAKDAELAQAFAKHLEEVTRRSWGDELEHTIKEMLVSVRETVTNLESQAASYEEQMEILKVKVELLKALLEPGLAREALGVGSTANKSLAVVSA